MTEPAKTPVTEAPKEKLSRSDIKAEIKRLAERLNKLEAQKHSGAKHRLPKERMLDASPLEKKDPEHHYLYVETSEPGNLQNHLDDGYTAVGEKECTESGVRQRVGDDVLMRIPQQEFEERVEEQKEVAKRRLSSYKAEFQKEVEGVVRELRDRGYTDHDISRILVDE